MAADAYINHAANCPGEPISIGLKGCGASTWRVASRRLCDRYATCSVRLFNRRSSASTLDSREGRREVVGAHLDRLRNCDVQFTIAIKDRLST